MQREILIVALAAVSGEPLRVREQAIGRRELQGAKRNDDCRRWMRDEGEVLTSWSAILGLEKFYLWVTGKEALL